MRDAKEFNNAIDDSRLVVLEDTGHIPMAERPGTVNDLVMEFLDEQGEAEDNISSGESSTATA
ncbi:MAG: alpha/beta hydrolase [Thermoleophilaceae bacterium]|nr:alpha/beta hydrolase [Thermoleophilaceae bacterium]